MKEEIKEIGQLILLKRDFGSHIVYEIHANEIKQKENLILSTKDGGFARRLVNSYNAPSVAATPPKDSPSVEEESHEDWTAEMRANIITNIKKSISRHLVQHVKTDEGDRCRIDILSEEAAVNILAPLLTRIKQLEEEKAQWGDNTQVIK